jgi:hypothetical protein
MNSTISIRRRDHSLAGLIGSVISHLLVLVAAMLFINISPERVSGGGGLLEISPNDIVGTESQPKGTEHNLPPGNDVVQKNNPMHKESVSDELMEKVTPKDKQALTEVPKPVEKLPELQKNQEKKNPDDLQKDASQQRGDINSDNGSGAGKYLGFAPGVGDTTGLKQVYTEKSLNVRISYPAGWTFIDQNQKNRLDGVTFWATNGIFNPPPYVFLEVQEKYLFNPTRFKYNTKINKAIIYYNDPEEMADQVTQTFYFRTEMDEDFSIKLSLKGKENFLAFQPVFFGMIKTFRFGNSWF